ncbi:MAG: hypothetical protein KI786_00495 [Mameliella sp.]|nr:hypothetical protein [Phaeodactylibacter sp.]
MKYIFLFLSLSVLFSSCTDEFGRIPNPKNAIEQLALIDVYKQLVSNEIKISATIANSQGNFSTALWEENNRASALSICKDGHEIACDYESIIIGDHVLPLKTPGGFRKNKHPEYKSVFGQEVDVYLEESESSLESRNDLYSSIYVPEVLAVGEMGVPNLQDGFTITWNGDSDNENGVYIILEYTAWENPRLYDEYPQNQNDFVNVVDNGSYTFQLSDFPNIPHQNALVKLTILRGVFDIVDIEGEDKFRVIAYSQAYGYARVN